MTDITNEYEWEIRILDPQVVDVADQFYDAAELLERSPNGGVIIPVIINRVFAIELYLKSLCSRSVIKNYQTYADGTSGGVIVPKSKETIHKLSRLFTLIKKDTKNILLKKYEKSQLSKDGN